MEFADEGVSGGGAAAEEEEASAAGASAASGEISEVERSKIGIMRAVVEREDPSAKDADDFMIRRFLRARDLDIEKASKLFLKYLSWRRSFVPNGAISASEIPNDLAQQKLFMQGSLEEFKRFVVYSLEKICSRMPGGQEKFLGIADLEGWGYKSSDVRGYLAALSILQDCYPERLGKLFLIHVPYIFMTAWRMVYPFIDPKTRRLFSSRTKNRELLCSGTLMKASSRMYTEAVCH
ncbi:hypothetical protein NL676_038103 [Syzygium grande]|nr:hypothetical protein NL676_038103 [Syzygium grande]